ncbi:P-loop containing nucleoside triphosphate hydrolase protein [Lentinula raphanica]|uniref:P-loop containing nucleoside triphosphate hydrolase protein n=1 Tax=Lentinula raphanica TaxID=153919 RepID=A0AA38PIX0_9AGAR|nr:P-loop containing nucleoside triphosphate hydrolase protein [Lentinula raphanica]KAJ3976559.1 P-loop containing nucleoside triphosphate hydrolase protein [Lentinula raphanica]
MEDDHNAILAEKSDARQGWDVNDTHEQKISFSDVAPVEIQMRQVSVDVAPPKNFTDIFNRQRLSLSPDLESSQSKGKRILDRISADFPRGSLCAIMGGSGSGKTTLLNILSHRMQGSTMVLSGSVTYNGSPDLSIVTSAYVTQMDLLLPSLTVRETLLYAAALRMPSWATVTERRNLVEEIILELGLKECANTQVGNGTSHRGCSGGERRRLSIGVQMLSNPSVLFCDEPTTGLDATSAYQLIKMLKALALKGRTIICTIHQPRHDIFFLFDSITLLSRGFSVFSGPTKESVAWFQHLVPGSFSELVNPADYLIGVAAVDNRDPEAETRTRTQLHYLVEAWMKESLNRFTPSAIVDDQRATRKRARLAQSAGVWRQMQVLTSRTIRTTIRDPMGLTASWMEAISMGLVCGLVFLNLPKTLAGIRSREAALYIACSLQGYLVLLYDIYRLTGPSLSLFDREHSERVVDVVPWVASTRLARLLLEDVIVPFLFSVIYYFMCGFDADAVQFFRFYAVVLLNQYIAVSFAMLCAAISRDFAIATLIANLMFTFQSFSCGFFIQAATIPVYVRWIKWVGYCFYGFAALVANEFSGKFYDCPEDGGPSDPACLQYSGDFILENLSFRPNWYTVPVCALLGFVIVFNLVAMLFLQSWTVGVQVAGIHLSKDKGTEGTERYQGVSHLKKEKDRDKSVDISVDLIDLTLTIEKTSLKNGFTKTHLPILHGVTTRFEAGSVNVIMGPSGSGKSSLLNLMALRLKSTPFTRYNSSGSLLLNGALPSESQFRSLCSYVTQDDNSLLPYLTVREMLRFAAGLRLPGSITAKQKRDRAEEVIRMMGLSDCADCLIGSEFVKGISGGEKRRASIAVQILTEPRILIADEPTSGLDAFTASSILDVLNGLAAEGRTVIITIHQSRSELFHKFGNLLLLAKGGRVAYSGKASSMISYFGHLGNRCPSNCNPSDWALDLISVDLRDEKAEAASRAKVEEILEAYEPEPSVSVEMNMAHEGKEGRHSGLSPDLIRMKKEPAPFYVAFPLLLRRGLINFHRQPSLGIARIGQVLGLGIVQALFFAPLKRDYIAASVNIVGAVQEILPLYFVGMLQNVALYPIERDVFYQEHDDGAYSVESFFATYVCLEVPFEIIAALLYSLLGDIAVNLKRTIPMYFIITLNCFCIVSCGESLGIIFNTLFQSTGFALNVTSVILSVGTFMGGLMSIDMIGFLQGVNYISPLKYATANMLPYTLRGMTFTCEASQRLADGECPLNTGEEVLDLYKLNVDPAPMLAALVCTTFVYRLVAYLILRLSRTDFSRFVQTHR